MMRLVIALLLAGIFLVVQVKADELVITVDGKSTWSMGSRKDGANFVYTEKETGEEKAVQPSQIAAVVPAVQRGQAYKPEVVKANIKRLEELREKYPSLLRVLNEMLSSWKALQKSSPEFEAQIAALVDGFAKSDKSPDIYRKTTLELGMIKFKDLQSVYAAKIDECSESMRREFVATNTERLVKMAAVAKMPPENFVALKKLAEPVAEATDAAGKSSIQAMVEKARVTSFEAGCSMADSVFLSGKSIDAYLKSAALLFLVKNEVANTEKQKSEVERRIAALRSSAAKTLASLRFDEDGFALGSEDMTLLSKTRSFARGVRFTDMVTDEEAKIIPMQSPGRLQVGQAYSVPIRVIFNRAQPQGREYGVTVMMMGRQQNLKRTLPFKMPALKNGRVDVTFRDEFTGVPDDFSLSADKKGGTYVYFMLACRDVGAQKPDDPWKTLSSGWALQMTP